MAAWRPNTNILALMAKLRALVLVFWRRKERVAPSTVEPATPETPRPESPPAQAEQATSIELPETAAPLNRRTRRQRDAVRRKLERARMKHDEWVLPGGPTPLHQEHVSAARVVELNPIIENGEDVLCD